MDITVSNLNKRMAVQLPAEFPLGLVFVVGQVNELQNGGQTQLSFNLIEDDYQLRCVLSERAAAETAVQEGDMIRAGGHLAFDPLHADYYLLVRDVSVVSSEPRIRQPALAPVLADIKKRSQAARLAPAELPAWVKNIAPPEVQADLTENGEEPTPAVAEPMPDTQAISEAESEPATPPLPVGLTEDLVQFLSEAMDSTDDLELTPDLIAELAPAIESPTPHTYRSPARPGAKKSADTQNRLLTVTFLIVFIIILIVMTYLTIAVLQGS